MYLDFSLLIVFDYVAACLLLLLGTFSRLKMSSKFVALIFVFAIVKFSWVVQGLGPYSTHIKKAEKEIKEMAKKVNDLCGMCL